MTYYRKQHMEFFKKALFASRLSDRYVAPSLPQPRPVKPAVPRPLAS